MRPLEPTSRIEPCLLESYPAPLADLISELIAVSAVLGGRLHATTAASLAELVRVMNCYYSNLIEGHNTRPRDIERALADELESDETRRDLQIEARAHNDAAVALARGVLLRGEIARGEAAAITGRPERTARDVLGKLVDARLLVSDTTKGPVRLSFTSESADVLFPRLFPAQVDVA